MLDNVVDFDANNDSLMTADRLVEFACEGELEPVAITARDQLVVLDEVRIGVGVREPEPVRFKTSEALALLDRVAVFDAVTIKAADALQSADSESDSESVAFNRIDWLAVAEGVDNGVGVLEDDPVMFTARELLALRDRDFDLELVMFRTVSVRGFVGVATFVGVLGTDLVMLRSVELLGVSKSDDEREPVTVRGADRVLELEEVRTKDDVCEND